MTKTTILTMTILIAGIIAPALNNASVFAATNIVNNGSFENAGCGSPFTTVYNLDGSTITGWTVGGDSVDWICGYWSAQDGTNSIDMSGNSAGSVSQDISTISGATYGVAFYMSGNTDGGNIVKQLTATAPGYSGSFTYDTTGKPMGSDWELKTFSFTATGTTSTLAFTSDELNAYGAALDNVSATLSACPEGYEIDGDTCVLSNQAPICDATSSVAKLWTPNHKMVSISLVGGSDPDGDPLTTTVTGVKQDEPTNAKGDGDKSPDATLSPLQVRSERSGTGDGRVYEISYTLSDGNGGSCTGIAQVSVPHDVAHPTAVNSGTTFNSTLP